jgi:hypothetical protein
MVQLIVKDTNYSRTDSEEFNSIYVSQSQKEIIDAIIKIFSESVNIPEQLTKSLLYRSISLILFGFKYGNCLMFEQNLNSEERRTLYNRISHQFLLLLTNVMILSSEQKHIIMGLNDYFIPLIEEHYSTDQDSD